MRNLGFDQGWFKTFHAEVPVVSIGNLTTGGTGKTPMVIWVAEEFRRLGIRVGILSRGYAAMESGENDEALELAERLPDVPNLINQDRVASARIAAHELEMQVLILDDGFQHRRLRRDLDIVLIDATCPFGFGYLLPRGLLREPLSSLKRADLILITRTDLISDDERAGIEIQLRRWNSSVPIISAATRLIGWKRADGNRFNLATLDGQKILLVSAIGNPEAFRKVFQRRPLTVSGEMVFQDHHHYSDDDIKRISATASQLNVDGIVCTVKDQVKLNRNRIDRFPLWALEIGMEITNGIEDVERKIQSVVLANRVV